MQNNNVKGRLRCPNCNGGCTLIRRGTGEDTYKCDNCGDEFTSAIVSSDRISPYLTARRALELKITRSTIVPRNFLRCNSGSHGKLKLHLDSDDGYVYICKHGDRNIYNPIKECISELSLLKNTYPDYTYQDPIIVHMQIQIFSLNYKQINIYTKNLKSQLNGAKAIQESDRRALANYENRLENLLRKKAVSKSRKGWDFFKKRYKKIFKWGFISALLGIIGFGGYKAYQDPAWLFGESSFEYVCTVTNTKKTGTSTFNRSYSIDVPRRDGYTFLGAFTDPVNGIKVIDNNGQSLSKCYWLGKSKTTLFFRFETKTFQITFTDEKEGSSDIVENHPFSETIYSFPLPDKVNTSQYDFVGWEYNDKIYKTSDSFIMPAQNIEFVAVWEWVHWIKITSSEQLSDSGVWNSSNVRFDFSNYIDGNDDGIISLAKIMMIPKHVNRLFITGKNPDLKIMFTDFAVEAETRTLPLYIYVNNMNIVGDDSRPIFNLPTNSEINCEGVNQLIGTNGNPAIMGTKLSLTGSGNLTIIGGDWGLLMSSDPKDGAYAIESINSLTIDFEGIMSLIGSNGTNGNDGDGYNSLQGTQGRDGKNGISGSNGGGAIKTDTFRINNGGKLTLLLRSGHGGNGGNGGNGEFGANIGTSAGNGGNGGNGGASGSIIIASTTLISQPLKIVIVEGGNGGKGGDGGVGGNTRVGIAGKGGIGGTPGNNPTSVGNGIKMIIDNTSSGNLTISTGITQTFGKNGQNGIIE